MKKVTGMLAVVAFASSMASAELLKNFKADGSVEALGQVISNSTDFDSKKSDKYGDVKNRVLVNAGFDMNDDASAVVSLVKCDRSYGMNTAQTPQNLLDNFYFEQAYLNLKGVFGVDHKIGRQYYGNDGDIVIYYGPANWYTRGLSNSPMAFDGWTTGWSKDKLAVGAAMAKIKENTGVAVGTTNNDKDLYGLTATYDYSEIVKPSFYIYELKDMSTVGKLNNLEVVGVKANGKFMGFDYKAEYAMNMGKDNATPKKYKGYALKANLDYAYELMGKWNFMGEFAMGSGNKAGSTSTSDKSFQAINANYRPGLILGGFGTITNLNNNTVWNVGANWNPSKVEKLNLEAKYYDFAYTQKNSGGVKRIGGEADLIATWNHSQSVALKLGLAAAMPTKKYSTSMSNTKTDAIKLANLYMNVKFN